MYSVASDETEVTDCGHGRSVRLTRNTVRISQRAELDLITAGHETDPEHYVLAVKQFYKHVRHTAVAVRKGWRFQDRLSAVTAYHSLCEILSSR